MALKIKLTKSKAGASETHLRTLVGLGLWRFGQERLLKDTPANRGMVAKVAHLVSHEVTKGEAPKRKRTKPRVARVREAARKAQAKSAARASFGAAGKTDRSGGMRG
ncbi:MAG: 50S ribosomal protein L30 [Myxococcaceae bacterium]